MNIYWHDGCIYFVFACEDDALDYADAHGLWLGDGCWYNVCYDNFFNALVRAR